jgi:hypothetical protein
MTAAGLPGGAADPQGDVVVTEDFPLVAPRNHSCCNAAITRDRQFTETFWQPPP